MKKQFSALIILSCLVLISTSCSNTKMLACPDMSDDRSVAVRSGKTYKPKRYKSANITHAKRKVRRSPSKVTEVAIGTELAEAKAVEVVERQATETPRHKIEPSVPALAMNLDSPIEYLRVLETENTPMGTASVKMDQEAYGIAKPRSVDSEEISDRYIAAPNEITVSTRNAKELKKEVRKERRKLLLNTILDSWKEKPSLGFAIAGFVCSVIGLIIFGIPLGILSIIFSFIALSRTQWDPNPIAKGFSIAGLVIGIADVVLVLLLLASM